MRRNATWTVAERTSRNSTIGARDSRAMFSIHLRWKVSVWMARRFTCDSKLPRMFLESHGERFPCIVSQAARRLPCRCEATRFRIKPHY